MQAIPEEAPQRLVTAGWAAFLFAAFLLAQMLPSLVVGTAIGCAAGLRSDAPDSSALRERVEEASKGASLVGFALGALSVALLAWRRARGAPGRFASEIGWSSGPARALLGGLVSGLALAACYAAVVTFAFPPAPGHRSGPVAEMVLQPGPTRTALIAIVLVLAPPVEEFLFRGALYTGVRAALGPIAAGAIATTLFVLLHAAEIAAYPPAALGISALALLTLGLRIRSGSLGPAILCHLGYNALIAVGVLLFT